MRAFHSFKLLLLSIMLFLLLYPVTSYSQTRPMNAKRILTIRNEITSGSEASYSSTVQMNNFFYQIDNPELIDSVAVHFIFQYHNEYQSGYFDSTYCINYTGTILWENGYNHIHYDTSTGEIIEIYKDILNRAIDYEYLSIDPSQYRRIRSYYNNFGKLDSLKYDTSDYQQIYRMNYDDSHLLCTLLQTYIELGENPNIIQYDITYPAGLPINPVDINIDEVLVYYNNSDIVKWRVIFDPHYQINPFNLLNISYNYTSNYFIYLNYFSEGYSLYFDIEGNIITYSHRYYTGDQSINNGAHFTWETIVPNDDPIAPTPELSLNVYPNPFSNRVNIDLKDTATAPSDIAIYNIKGQMIRKWDGNKSSAVSWDGKDRFNTDVSRGVYLIQVQQDGKSHTAKIVKF